MQDNLNLHICQNCGTDLRGKFCFNCGQKAAATYDRSFRSFFEHFTEEFFVYDSRFFRSIKYLFIRPGYLTHEYISGRVQRYISPLKMFLFTSLVIFFILTKIDSDSYKSLVTESTEDTEYLSSFILEQKEASSESEDLFIDNFNEEINGNVTLYIFFIMVAFSVLLKIVYVTKKIYYVEHIVFTLHFFTFVLWCLLLSSLLNFTGDLSVILFLYLVPGIYLFLALKTAYHKSLWGAVLASGFLTFCYWILVTVWALGTIYISALKA